MFSIIQSCLLQSKAMDFRAIDSTIDFQNINTIPKLKNELLPSLGHLGRISDCATIFGVILNSMI